MFVSICKYMINNKFRRVSAPEGEEGGWRWEGAPGGFSCSYRGRDYCLKICVTRKAKLLRIDKHRFLEMYFVILYTRFLKQFLKILGLRSSERLISNTTEALLKDYRSTEEER